MERGKPRIVKGPVVLIPDGVFAIWCGPSDSHSALNELESSGITEVIGKDHVVVALIKHLGPEVGDGAKKRVLSFDWRLRH